MGLQFGSTPDQLQGRVLEEASLTALSRPCFEDCEPEEIFQEEPPPPELPPPPVEVVQPEDPFKFRGLVQKLKARVVDSRSRSYSRARRGALLSTIRLEGDFGKPEAAVTLTFYRRSATRSRRRRADARRRTRRARGARSVRVVKLKPIARFDPFVVKRGHVTMRLKVPRLFKPTYVGVTVREVARTANGRRRLSGGQPCTRLKTRKRVPFRCTGPTRGVIVRIADANRLHKRKGGAHRKRKGGARRPARRR